MANEVPFYKWAEMTAGSFAPSRRKERDAAIADSGNFHSRHTRLPSAHLHFHLVLPGRSRVFLAEAFLIDLTRRLVAAAAAEREIPWDFSMV